MVCLGVMCIIYAYMCIYVYWVMDEEWMSCGLYIYAIVIYASMYML